MVSSTFFDLRQIRADLSRFIENEMGYRALLSEFHSFPVEPDADTIENCRRRVEQDADILVLVIGTRYGSVDKATSKSITNLEYLAARSKGIPIFAFVEKSVVTLQAVWERNPSVDLSHAVSDTRLFEFVGRVRDVDRVWTHEFEYAQTIIDTLRIQLAYLMSAGLRHRLRFGQQPDATLVGLSGKPLRTALEKPEAWEYRLFAQVLADEVEKSSDLRREHELGLAFGPGESIEKHESTNWMHTRMDELRISAAALVTLMNEALPEALGPPGTPGNVATISFISRRIGAVYRHVLEWSQRVRRAHVHACFQPVLKEMSLFPHSIIQSIEQYGPDLLASIEQELSKPRDGNTRVVDATLTLELFNLDGFNAALARAEKDCFSDA
jgi:hypothetical protein